MPDNTQKQGQYWRLFTSTRKSTGERQPKQIFNAFSSVLVFYESHKAEVELKELDE